ncbi:LemA family protein [Pseudomonas sp. K2I15]|uniref:LemA family protein n=1 Tax=unclassified Pseudomonas TaxID=196821 RepID=UPI000B4DD839|nr:LemA family protein [Pseudomonas sp. K2I15]OWP72452.1 hypothetical protein CEC48_08015 [Pseudomonas sp. K2I15]
MTGTHLTIIIVTVLTLLALYVFGTYNELVALRDRSKKAFVQLGEALRQLDAARHGMAAGEVITGLEQRVTFSRQLFTDSVTNYNTYKHKSPTSVVANLLGHREDASLSGVEDKRTA